MQVFRKMTDEEKKRVQTFEIDGMMRTVDEIKSRRKKKGDFQYEISWKGLPSIKYNKWFTREVLALRSCCHHCCCHHCCMTHLQAFGVNMRSLTYEPRHNRPNCNRHSACAPP